LGLGAPSRSCGGSALAFGGRGDQWVSRESFGALVAAYTRGSLDVPAGLFTPRTTFSLNDRSYETILGGSPEDPLIRLLTRGVGGYRTAAKALQYALQQPVVSVESLSDPDGEGARIATLRVEGQLRHSNEGFAVRCAVRMTCSNMELADVNVRCSDDDLARIASARH
jgi:hypothetical protein